jgi:reductive dehalogenase
MIKRGFSPHRRYTMHWLFIVTGLLFCSAALGFAFTSFCELESRAGLLSLLFTCIFATIWFGLGLAFPGTTFSVAVAAWAATVIVVILLALPAGKPQPLKIDQSRAERFDERHIMFGRAELREGTPQYDEYYIHLNPKSKETDDGIRAMPELGGPGAKYYDHLDSPYMVSVFEFIEKYRHLADPGKPVGSPAAIDPHEATRRIKGFARHLGVLDVRVTRLRDYHVYSHAGRHLSNWGEEIRIRHPYAVVFSVEMNHRMVLNAPLLPTGVETATEYMRIANISICLATYIKNLGYDARAHLDGNYQVMATAVAHDAGLGELGRLGLIITPTHGPRVRTAVVTTDLPLMEDQPINFGVQHFCEICKKCAENCPSQSIEKGDKREIRGVTKWQSKMESCFKYWRSVGTDCSICLAVCPYSKPDTFYHRVLRFFIRRNALARRMAFFMDDLLYGKRPRHVHKPEWFSPA